HHNPPEILPEAEALINPKLGSKDTPFYSLSGVGVAFKLAQALYQKLNNNSALAQKYLDLVAMGTVADVVPLIGENRILTYFGLKKLSKSNWPGVELLKSLSGIKKEINTRSIGYILGPRINAAGRIEDAGIAVDLLLAKSEKQAKPLADKLNHLNYKRREIGAQIFDDTLNQIQENKDILNNKVIILSSDKWHPGVTGIVASQLVRKYNRPTVLITLEGDTARGSIRSPDGIGIFDALRQCQDLFINYGGHQEAAGFEIDATKVTEFQKRYTSLLNTSVTEEMLIPEIKIDLELPSDQISIELVQELNCLAPFGQGNSLPIFSNNSLEVLDFRQVGDGTHLKLTLKNGKKYFDGIGFGLGEYAKLLDSSEGPWEFAFSLGVNEWNGQQKTELTLYDIRPK
ncbi:MAG: single-stranded-DNA-specific exonuclease RecJ, partial [Candidatus Margulisbacteria bacterium]|nr:single-stranded-DNA-specific exonuclease RecJ [Candidatus Margulisiibacteriota bacterium]